MKWITGITLNNYRAFKGSYSTIAISAKNHLLIYGENGSGKSSIYDGVKDFFNSSTDPTKLFEVNLFSQLTCNNAGTIELKIADLNTSDNVIAENSFWAIPLLPRHRGYVSCFFVSNGFTNFFCLLSSIVGDR
jgi:predicted ATP-dependent endonuclease of OLD family